MMANIELKTVLVVMMKLVLCICIKLHIKSLKLLKGGYLLGKLSLILDKNINPIIVDMTIPSPKPLTALKGFLK